MTTVAAPPASAEPRVTGAVTATRRVADVLEMYSAAAARIARVVAVLAVLAIMVMTAGNVFTRNVPGYSLFSSEELARWSYLWAIWMGVSLAVKRSAVTTITFLSNRGPLPWQRAIQTFAGVALAVLIGFSCVRSTQYVLSREGVVYTGEASGISAFYPIASMTVGYYFIAVHYLAAVARGAVQVAQAGTLGLRRAGEGLVGALLIGAVLWGVCWVLLAHTGVSRLVVLGIVFVTLTLSGMPVVFMLSLVGILAFLPSFVGLSFYPSPDPLVAFKTTMGNMGLSAGGELLVIVMFLVVAEVLNASGMSARLISFAASLVGHFRGGMAYVSQLTSLLVAGVSGSAQADAAIMTPILVPAMEREGYRRDVAAAVVSGASIKGAIGPLSVMFIIYGTVVTGSASASIKKLLVSGLPAIMLLFFLQALTIYAVVRRTNMLPKRRFVGWRQVGVTGWAALPVLAIPVIILGGIFAAGAFTPTESAAVGAVVSILMALFLFGSLSPSQLPGVLTLAAIEAGIVMLLLGDSQIIAKALFIDNFSTSLQNFLTGLTSDKYVFLLVVNLLLLVVGIFLEPLPALWILAPSLATVAVNVYGVDPVHFGLIVVFNLVLALIHPPIGLVLFLVSSISGVTIERLSITIIPWFLVSLLVLVLVTYLPDNVVLVATHLLT
ncbi:MAG: TRAP transporter large permease subunit [Thermoleophilia bacterium]